ncbi:hypothetical protein Sru01_47800 [Sphaerisporangium rufum]|uniref:DUF4367 domain-containing protein n=1 Tax=Sphaerisporangium rufum TaxID=1381558 RepID=A0A919V384_9ACTN|nr:hypothetical protein [Sphaerisporangium rufum]GII79798.1 hypothetical protein Sru01_47800 [Sphaerisporangium rufum]
MTSSDDPERTAPPPEDALERELLALGAVLEVPAPPPDAVARAVRARLAAEDAPAVDAAPARPAAARRPRRWRRVAALVAAVTLALAGLTPQGQAAVARVLRFAGVQLDLGGPGPLPSGGPSGVPSPLPGERRTSLAEARRAVAFPFGVPAVLGEPPEVRIADHGRVVSLLWPGVRLDAYDGLLDVVWRKELGPPWPEDVTVGADPGRWIAGPHELIYLPRAGRGPVPLARRAAATLIWRHGGTGYRLEGPVDLTAARRIAGSVR